MKKFIFLFFVLFFVSNVSAVNLRMGPPQINLVGNTNDFVCSTFTIKVDEVSNLSGSIYWANEGFSDRNLNLHKLNSADLDLITNFDKNILVNGSKSLNFCMKARKAGDYHGALMYKIKNKPVRVGIWVNATIEGNSIIKITGNSVKDFNLNTKKVLIYLPIVLVLTLLALLKISKKRSKF